MKKEENEKRYKFYRSFFINITFTVIVALIEMALTAVFQTSDKNSNKKSKKK